MGDVPAMTKTVMVRLSAQRSYPILIQPHALEQVGDFLRSQHIQSSLMIISQSAILRRHGKKLFSSLRSANFSFHTAIVPPGETAKDLHVVERVIGEMLRKQMDRATTVVAFGGGVVGDVAGLVAALYLRGIPFVQIPTTLLAQVDSAVGGKVAVNHPFGKNLIGAFWQPKLVITDPGVLSTLPRRQLRAGLAEIIKIAAIQDKNLFSYLEEHLPMLVMREPKVLSLVIAKACSIKARIVEADETEQGCRTWLNYGHTLGHALEAYHRYQGYLHGEAISIGMVASAMLAYQLGYCSKKTMERQRALIAQAGLPIHGKHEGVEKLMALIKVDKKTRKGELNFVLTPQIGRARICRNLRPFSVRQVIRAVVGA
jgi:3-dehydroquinate synthase